MLSCPGLALAQTLPPSDPPPDEPQVFSLRQSLRGDSNLFRVPADQGPQRELISTTAIGLVLNRDWGRQRFVGDFVLGWADYRDNSDLSGAVYDLRARLDWSTVNRIAGELGVRSRSEQYLNRDSATVYTQDNRLTTSSAFLNIRKGNVTPWTLEGGLAASDARYSASAFSRRNVQQLGANLGLRYRFKPNTSLRLGLRHAAGRYPNYGLDQVDDFRRTDVELSGAMEAGGASVFDARLAYGRTTHSEVTRREGNDWSGALRWKWQPTGKLLFTTQLSRDSSTGAAGFDDPLLPGRGSDARRTAALDLTGRWQATAKLAVQADLGLERRQLDNAFVTGGVGGLAAQADDRTLAYGLAVRFKPTPLSDLSCRVGRERRSTDTAASALTYAYLNSTLGCMASVGWR